MSGREITAKSSTAGKITSLDLGNSAGIMKTFFKHSGHRVWVATFLTLCSRRGLVLLHGKGEACLSLKLLDSTSRHGKNHSLLPPVGAAPLDLKLALGYKET